MKRSRLRNKFLRDRTDISKEEYEKQINFCVSLLKKAKKNLEIWKSVTDSKKFWQTVKLLFSNNLKAKTFIKLVENDEMIDDESKIAKVFNEYFVNTAKTGNINRRTNYVFCSKPIRRSGNGYN